MIKVLKSLARNVGTKAAEMTIASDAATKSAPLSRRVVANYLEALERVMVTENSPSWTPQLRSRAGVNGTPTRYFIDPALAAVTFGASRQVLLGVYMQSIGGEVKQYRDEDKLEVNQVADVAKRLLVLDKR